MEYADDYDEATMRDPYHRIGVASAVALLDNREVKLVVVAKPDGTFEITEVEDVNAAV